MTLDNEEQRSMLLELIGAATFSGAAIEKIYALKKSIETSDVNRIENNS